MTIHLSEKATLARLSVSRWGGHKFDAKVTAEVHKANDARRDTGNYNKRLLPKGSTLKIDQVIYEARTYYRTMTMPWLDDGVRILPNTHAIDYAARMQKLRQEFEKEVRAFEKDYPSCIKQAKTVLGKLFNETDYPSVKSMLAKFGWEHVILPFPDARDFRVTESGLPQDAVDQMKADLQASMEKVWQDALHDTGERIAQVVGHMSEKLKAYKPGDRVKDKRAEGTFKDSLVSNVQELVDLLPSFNLSGDPKLNKIIVQMKKELCKHDADSLRNDDKLRKKVATSADAVLSQLADFIA